MHFIPAGACLSQDRINESGKCRLSRARTVARVFCFVAVAPASTGGEPPHPITRGVSCVTATANLSFVGQDRKSRPVRCAPEKGGVILHQEGALPGATSCCVLPDTVATTSSQAFKGYKTNETSLNR